MKLSEYILVSMHSHVFLARPNCPALHHLLLSGLQTSLSAPNLFLYVHDENFWGTGRGRWHFQYAPQQTIFPFTHPP